MTQKFESKFVSEPAEKISWENRILLYVAQKDAARGRDASTSGWYEDLKEAR